MQLQEFSNAASYLDRTRDLLFGQEIANNLLLSSAIALSKGGIARVPSLSFFTVFRDDRPVASLLRSSNKRLILSTADESSATYLGEEISKRAHDLRGIFAPASIAEAFVEGLERGGGARPEKRLAQDLMILEKPTPIEAASGVFRAALRKDLSLLVTWAHAFADECGLDETSTETEEVVRKYLENRQLFVWDVGGRAVAMAAYGGITPKAARISMVYTDPSQRNRGFAGTLVHRLSHRLFDEGLSACVLFVDAANPVSKHVYEKLGFKTIASFADYRFS
ncbi:MAG: GNAT family N-acetyltransferase [Bdellovibrionota bacterium]